MNADLQSLKGIGPKSAERLSRLGLTTPQDVLFHLPLRYEDRTRLTPLYKLTDGMETVVAGSITHTEIINARQRMLVCHIRDQYGIILLRFFHFSRAQQDYLKPGTCLQCFGKVKRGKTGWEMIHPEFHVIKDLDSIELSNKLTPVYPTTDGLRQDVIRGAVRQVLRLAGESAQIKEFLPQELLRTFDLPDIVTSLEQVHFPEKERHEPAQNDEGCNEKLNEAFSEELNDVFRQRLAFEELLSWQISLRRIRREHQVYTAPVAVAEPAMVRQFIEHLPYTLTGAQKRVAEEIIADMRLGYPMHRLLQGDVGAGKTVIAAISALTVIDSGYQAVLMAPTELLARQHFDNLSQSFKTAGLDIPLAWLAGSTPDSEARTVLQQLYSGEVQLAIGTHALFQTRVEFARVGLVIIDEQHRFGVRQRLTLWQKGHEADFRPHMLVMTATPIPRTLAMTAYADLDTSVLDELPPGRLPVKTVALPSRRRTELIQRIQHACGQGRQVYWVCTLIEESDKLQCQAAEETHKMLVAELPELRIALVHGRMKDRDKQEVMDKFRGGDYHLLVATTVIEVGVDIPNADLMIIEDAQRLGLSQLHQLRGRVGRGKGQGVCVLLYSRISAKGRERLLIMQNTTDGFELARKDLELRGPGEWLGTRQSGLAAMKIADLNRDADLIYQVERAAKLMLEKYPDHCDALIGRWIGNNVSYKNA